METKDIIRLTEYRHLVLPAPTDIVYVYESEGRCWADRVLGWVLTGSIDDRATEGAGLAASSPLTYENTRMWIGKAYAIAGPDGDIEDLPSNTVWVGPRDDIPDEYKAKLPKK